MVVIKYVCPLRLKLIASQHRRSLPGAWAKREGALQNAFQILPLAAPEPWSIRTPERRGVRLVRVLAVTVVLVVIIIGVLADRSSHEHARLRPRYRIRHGPRLRERRWIRCPWPGHDVDSVSSLGRVVAQCAEVLRGTSWYAIVSSTGGEGGVVRVRHRGGHPLNRDGARVGSIVGRARRCRGRGNDHAAV